MSTAVKLKVSWLKVDFDKWVDEDETSDGDQTELQLDTVDTGLNADWLTEATLGYDPRSDARFDQMPPLEMLPTAAE